MKKSIFPAAALALALSAGGAQAWGVNADQLPHMPGIKGATLDTVLPHPAGKGTKWMTVTHEIRRPMTLRECFGLGLEAAQRNPEGTATVTCKRGGAADPVVGVFICDAGSGQGPTCWTPRMQ